MNTHHLKIWPEYFKEVVEGRKKAEVRVNDRNYQVGDILVLQEYNAVNPALGHYTGSVTVVKVTHVNTFLIEKNYLILSFEIIYAYDYETDKTINTISECYQPLFDHMVTEHNKTLTVTEMNEVIELSKKVSTNINTLHKQVFENNQGKHQCNICNEIVLIRENSNACTIQNNCLNIGA